MLDISLDNSRLESTLAVLALVFIAAGVALGWRLVLKRRRRRIMRKRRQASDKDYVSLDYAAAQDEFERFRDEIHQETDAITIEIIHDVDENRIFKGRHYREEEAPEDISYDEALLIAGRLRRAPEQEIFLLIHTLGGYSLPSMQIADAISKHKGKVTAFIPYVAMSGGTLIALACDEVWMGPVARLGPIDTTFYGVSAESWRSLGQHKPLDQLGDETLLLRREVEKFEDGFKGQLPKIVHPGHVDVAERLSRGDIAHGYAISREEAIEWGVNVLEKADKRTREKIIKRLLGMLDAKLTMIRTADDDKRGRKAASAPVPGKVHGGFLGRLRERLPGPSRFS